MDPHTDSSDTKGGHETYTQGMAPSSLFQTVAPKKTSGDLVALAIMVFMWWINVGPYRYWTALTDVVEDMQLVGNYLEVF